MPALAQHWALLPENSPINHCPSHLSPCYCQETYRLWMTKCKCFKALGAVTGISFCHQNTERDRRNHFKSFPQFVKQCFSTICLLYISTTYIYSISLLVISGLYIKTLFNIHKMLTVRKCILNVSLDIKSQSS